MTRSQFQRGPAQDHYHTTLGVDEIPLESIGEVTGFLTASTTLTDAQIKGLGSGAAVTIVSAPGAGKVIVPFVAFISVDTAGGEYTGIDATAYISLAYVGGSDASTLIMQAASSSIEQLLGANEDITWATLMTRSWSPAGGGAVEVAVYDASEGENLPLGISGFNGGDGDFTGGNATNTARVKVWYFIEDLA